MLNMGFIADEPNLVISDSQSVANPQKFQRMFSNFDEEMCNKWNGGVVPKLTNFSHKNKLQEKQT